jgi:protein-S-isoprenylcysteine O-methyltransferase Ste14
MTLAHLLFALAIQFEEGDLAAEHGTAYEAYRRKVPMLLPGFHRSRTHEIDQEILQ